MVRDIFASSSPLSDLGDALAFIGVYKIHNGVPNDIRRVVAQHAGCLMAQVAHDAPLVDKETYGGVISNGPEFFFRFFQCVFRLFALGDIYIRTQHAFFAFVIDDVG